MFFQRGRHLSKADYPGREAMRIQNLGEKRVLVAEGWAHGILVYNDGQPVGWCQYGPPEELPRPGGGGAQRSQSRLSATGRWRLSEKCAGQCHRRRGVADVALHAALYAIRERGGGLVEADPPVPPIRADWKHGGTISLFEREGFIIVDRPNAPYVVMQHVI